MDILDSEKRRARNLIWNAAGDYSFEPDFKAYDEEGRADLYWNSIIGAVRKNYGPETIDALFAAFHGSSQEALYEQLVWLGLENAVYQREAARRPALPALSAVVGGEDFPRFVADVQTDKQPPVRQPQDGRRVEILPARVVRAPDDGVRLRDWLHAFPPVRLRRAGIRRPADGHVSRRTRSPAFWNSIP